MLHDMYKYTCLYKTMYMYTYMLYYMYKYTYTYYLSAGTADGTSSLSKYAQQN